MNYERSLKNDFLQTQHCLILSLHCHLMIQKTTCPSCKRVLRNVNAWHYCKQISIDDLFLNKADNIVLAFDRLLEIVSQWSDVEISATKNCIVFVKNKTFLVAKPMTKCLEIKFYSNHIIDDERLYKCAIWGNKYEGIVSVENESQLTTFFFNFFKNSYQIS